MARDFLFCMSLALADSDAGFFVVLLQFFVLLPFEHRELLATSERETCVGDGQTTLQELCLVGRLHRQLCISIACAVDVVVRCLARQREVAYDLVGVAVEVLRVGLEVYPTIGREELRVVLQEDGRREAFLRATSL